VPMWVVVRSTTTSFLTVLEGTVSINSLLAFLPPVVPVV
jgi:hypothetical protein